jgi:hypothetical protein
MVSFAGKHKMAASWKTLLLKMELRVDIFILLKPRLVTFVSVFRPTGKSNFFQ